MTRLKPDVRDIDPVNFKFQPMFYLSTRSVRHSFTLCSTTLVSGGEMEVEIGLQTAITNPSIDVVSLGDSHKTSVMEPRYRQTYSPSCPGRART